MLHNNGKVPQITSSVYTKLPRRSTLPRMHFQNDKLSDDLSQAVHNSNQQG